MFKAPYDPKKRQFLKATGMALGTAALSAIFPGVVNAASYRPSHVDDKSAYLIQNSDSWQNLPLISTPRDRPCPHFLDLENPGRPPTSIERALAREGPEIDRLEEKIQMISSNQGPMPASVSSYKGIVKIQVDRSGADEKLGRYTFTLKTINPGEKHILETNAKGIAVLKLKNSDTYIDPTTGIIRPGQIQIVTKKQKAVFPSGFANAPENPGALKTVITYDVNQNGRATFIQHSVPEEYVFDPYTNLYIKAPIDLLHANLNRRESSSFKKDEPTMRARTNRDDHSKTFKQQRVPVEWNLVLDPDFRDNPWTRDFIENEFIPLIEKEMTNGSIHYNISYDSAVRDGNIWKWTFPNSTTLGEHDPNAGAPGGGTNNTRVDSGNEIKYAHWVLREDGPLSKHPASIQTFRKHITHEMGATSLGTDGENKYHQYPNSWNEDQTPKLTSPGHWDKWLAKTNHKLPIGTEIKSKKIKK